MRVMIDREIRKSKKRLACEARGGHYYGDPVEVNAPWYPNEPQRVLDITCPCGAIKVLPLPLKD